MRKSELSRYAVTGNGEIIIDVAAQRVQDLYNDFDRTAPYVRRDLDYDLSEYLADCAREIGKKSFIIRITMQKMPPEETIERVKKSISNYFRYIGNLEKKKIGKTNITSLILLFIGLSILGATIFFTRMSSIQSRFFTTLLMEGLTIAAWVSLWEALATFLIEWMPFRRSLRLFDNLAHASVVFAEGIDTETGSIKNPGKSDKS